MYSISSIVEALYYKLREPKASIQAVIPSPTDQNPWAHWRNPMDMMRQG